MTDEPDEKLPPETEQPAPEEGTARRIGGIFIGCLLLVFLIWIIANLAFAIIGLITGYLYLPPARGSEGIELYGVWARVVSVIVLLFYGGIAFLIVRWSRKQRRPKILGGYDNR